MGEKCFSDMDDLLIVSPRKKDYVYERERECLCVDLNGCVKSLNDTNFDHFRQEIKVLLLSVDGNFLGERIK